MPSFKKNILIMLKGNRKLMFALLFGILSMTLSYASLYTEDLRINEERTFDISNFGTVSLPIKTSITAVYSRAHLYVNISKGCGTLVVYIITSGGEHAILDVNYNGSQDYYRNLMRYTDLLSEADEIRLIVNAINHTEGSLRLTIEGVEQPYYFLSLIAIPLVLVAIVMFFMGMYDAFVAIKESQKRRFWE
ncbi:MAG TPA: hypothetical protein ENK81_02810 [Euryarchaeota archaeon]|nr:hypothetical protein [Euryarchaeota archaeon]HHC19317.1 hypothetical protein [Euryarchaeota archaeon]